jgi:hypothetical protein
MSGDSKLFPNGVAVALSLGSALAVASTVSTRTRFEGHVEGAYDHRAIVCLEIRNPVCLQESSYYAGGISTGTSSIFVRGGRSGMFVALSKRDRRGLWPRPKIRDGSGDSAG